MNKIKKERVIKNIILSIIIILSAGSIYLTMNYIKNNVTTTSTSRPEMNGNMTPPDMPGGNMENNTANEQNTNNNIMSKIQIII